MSPVPFRSDPLDELVIPDGTTVEEHDLVAAGDVLVGGQTAIEFGVRGQNVIAGERVSFAGDIEAEGDCRLDMWCDVGGNVLVGEDAYLGERVHVGGQLIVSGDLDIGDDVDIEEGFEANGWIVIRNPVPTLVFLFIYLSQLLRIGEEEAAREVVSELLDGDRDEEPVIIPRGSRVDDDAWRVSTPARIGRDCRLHGNVRATTVDVGRKTEVFGSLRARRDVGVAAGAVIHGDVTTRGGSVRVGAHAHVRGDVACNDLVIHDDAEVDGAIRARGEVSFVSADSEDVTRLETDDSGSTPTEASKTGPTESGQSESDHHAAESDERRAETSTVETTATDRPIPAIVRVGDSLGDSLEELESVGNGDGGLIAEAEDR